MTARLLSIDTTNEFGSLALLEDGEIKEELSIHSPDGFGHILFEHLSALIGRHGWNLNQIDCFAGASGPGSFTGIRVGLACVKGLAEACGKPVVSVSNLQALALFGTAAVRAPVLDARRGQVYGAVYDADLKPIAPEIVTPFSTWLESLPLDDLQFISTDFAPFRSVLAGTRFEKCEVVDAPGAMAGAVGKIAYARFQSGLAEDPERIDANYVRRSDAELLFKP